MWWGVWFADFDGDFVGIAASIVVNDGEGDSVGSWYSVLVSDCNTGFDGGVSKVPCVFSDGSVRVCAE